MCFVIINEKKEKTIVCEKNSDFHRKTLNVQLSHFRQPGLGNYGNEGAAHGYTDMSQQTAGRFSAPATPNPFSSTGGNPFG